MLVQKVVPRLPGPLLCKRGKKRVACFAPFDTGAGFGVRDIEIDFWKQGTRRYSGLAHAEATRLVRAVRKRGFKARLKTMNECIGVPG